MLQVYQSSVLSHQNRSSLKPRVPVHPIPRHDPSCVSGAWKVCITHTLKVTPVCAQSSETQDREDAEQRKCQLICPHPIPSCWNRFSLALHQPLSFLTRDGWEKKMMMESAQQRHVGHLRGSELECRTGGGRLEGQYPLSPPSTQNHQAAH